MQTISFDRRIAVAIPANFHRALTVAASSRGQSLADLVRSALQRELVQARIPFQQFPDLERQSPKRPGAAS